MKQGRLERWSPLSGILAAALTAVGGVMVGVYEYLPAAEDLVQAFSGNSTRLMGSGYVGYLAAFFLVWFAGSIYTELRRAEGTEGWLSLLAFGGGLASGVTLGLGFSALFATGARVGAEGGISPIEAVTLYDYYGNVLGNTLGLGFAVFIGASAIVALRANLLPSWFSWLSLILAIALLTPATYIFLAGALIWLLVMSIWLLRRRGRSASSAESTAEVG